MNCREFLARHSEYVDGVIDALSEAQMTAHVRGCASCARYDRVVRRGGELVRQLPAIAVSSAFESRVRHRLYHVRDEMRQRRAGAASILAAAASVVFIAVSAGVVSLFVERTPVVDAQVVWAEAPLAFTPIEAHSFVAEPPRAADDEALSPLDAAAKGHDPHLAGPAPWPVYSRDQAAVAFRANHTEVVVRPAQLGGSRLPPAVPILVRH